MGTFQDNFLLFILTTGISDPVSIPEAFVYYWFVVCLGWFKFNYSAVSLESFFTSLENLV